MANGETIQDRLWVGIYEGTWTDSDARKFAATRQLVQDVRAVAAPAGTSADAKLQMLLAAIFTVTLLVVAIVMIRMPDMKVNLEAWEPVWRSMVDFADILCTSLEWTSRTFFGLSRSMVDFVEYGGRRLTDNVAENYGAYGFLALWFLRPGVML